MGKFTLYHAIKAKRERSTAVVFLYPRRWIVVGGELHAPVTLPPERDPVPIVQESGCVPGLVWTVAENLAPNGIRYPDRPAHIKSKFKWIL